MFLDSRYQLAHHAVMHANIAIMRWNGRRQFRYS